MLHPIGNSFMIMFQVILDMFYWRMMKRFIFFRVGKQNKSEKLEIFHTYVWGLTQVQSLGGSRYYVTFIDDAKSRKP